MNKSINRPGDNTAKHVTQLSTIGGVISITHKHINRLLTKSDNDIFLDANQSGLFNLLDESGQSLNLALASESYLVNTGMRLGIKAGSKPLVIGNIDSENIYIVSTNLTRLRVLNILTATFELKRRNKNGSKFDS